MAFQCSLLYARRHIPKTDVGVAHVVTSTCQRGAIWTEREGRAGSRFVRDARGGRGVPVQCSELRASLGIPQLDDGIVVPTCQHRAIRTKHDAVVTPIIILQCSQARTCFGIPKVNGMVVSRTC